MSWPLARFKTFAPGGSHLPADSNGMQDLVLNATGIHLDGRLSIATAETRTNAAYGLMTTPDRIQNVVLPTDGFIAVMYKAIWQESQVGQGRAAIFLGANQLQIGNTAPTLPSAQETAIQGASQPNADTHLFTIGAGLFARNVANLGNVTTSDVTTGQVIGDSSTVGGQSCGFCYMFAAAGTYDVSVQFKSAAGSITVKNRHIWVGTGT